MAYFHVNEPNQTPTYQFCMLNEPYITGLESGQVLVHLDPAFMQRDNGLLVGVDQRFKDFYIVNEKNIVVSKLSIEWNECINSASNPLIETSQLHDNRTPIFWIGLISLFIISTMIKRMKPCKHF